MRAMLLGALALVGAVAPLGCSDDGGGAADAGATDVAADVAAPATSLVINEVFARPTGADTDWIELLNVGDRAVSLVGWVITDDDPTHQHALTGTLEPGAYLVVERVAGGLSFGFGATDEAHLLAPDGAEIDATAWQTGQVAQGRSWGRMPNGAGDFASLTPTPWAPNEDDGAICGDGAIQVGEACDAPDYGGISCTGAGFAGGALGCDRCERVLGKGCEPHAGPLRINEVSAELDKIELINASDAPLPIGGHRIVDRVVDDPARDYVLPALTLAAGELLVLTTGQAQEFGLGTEETLTLRQPDGKVIDLVEWQIGDAANSYCRQPDGDGPFVRCAQPTFGALNSPP